jgi:hypothetical protein
MQASGFGGLLFASFNVASLIRAGSWSYLSVVQSLRGTIPDANSSMGKSL